MKTSELYLKALQRLIDGDDLSYRFFTYYREFTHPFRKTYRFIKRLIKWVPILWNNENWDYAYLLEVIRVKLVELERDQVEDSLHKGNIKKAREIRATVERIDRFNDDEKVLTSEEKDIINQYMDTIQFKERKTGRKRFKIVYEFIWTYPFVREVKKEIDEVVHTLVYSEDNKELESKYHSIFEKQLKNKEKNWKFIFRNIFLKGRGWWS